LRTLRAGDRLGWTLLDLLGLAAQIAELYRGQATALTCGADLRGDRRGVVGRQYRSILKGLFRGFPVSQEPSDQQQQQDKQKNRQPVTATSGQRITSGHQYRPLQHPHRR
jgi:hypothetical protein